MSCRTLYGLLNVYLGYQLMDMGVWSACCFYVVIPADIAPIHLLYAQCPSQKSRIGPRRTKSDLNGATTDRRTCGKLRQYNFSSMQEECRRSSLIYERYNAGISFSTVHPRNNVGQINRYTFCAANCGYSLYRRLHPYASDL